MKSLEDRFWDRVDKTDECWVWKGSSITTHGNEYGQVYLGKVNGKKVQKMAHRYAYELLVGPIPEGMVIDHLCRNGLCVRPEHLEAKTNVANVMIGIGLPARNSRKTHCRRGHELTPDNTWNRADGRRACKLCDSKWWKNSSLTGQ